MSETERDPSIRTAPVKITDVAAAAGVAPMTVSRVINTPDRVSPETTARVRARTLIYGTGISAPAATFAGRTTGELAP